MLRKLTALGAPLHAINKSFTNHYLIRGNVQQVIWYMNSFDCACVSRGERELGAHSASGQWPGLGQVISNNKKEEAGGTLWLRENRNLSECFQKFSVELSWPKRFIAVLVFVVLICVSWIFELLFWFLYYSNRLWVLFHVILLMLLLFLFHSYCSD